MARRADQSSRGIQSGASPSASSVEGLPPSVSCSPADNLDRPRASMHNLRRRGREPVTHQDDQHLDREAVREQDLFGAAVR
jgi:hypothetical protein